jgi:hypothetical protein
MKAKEIMNGVSRKFNRLGLSVKKHSPEILLVVGIGGVVTSAVLACKATTKVDFILAETKQKVDIIHEGVEKGEVMTKLENGEVGVVPYNEEDGKKDLTIVYAQTGLEFVKLYAPSVILGVASIGCILASHNIIHKRNVALGAAYAAVDSSFKDYRKRVVERFGEELDKELRYNIKAKEIEEVAINEDGSETTVKKTVNAANPNDFSEYTICFDETCKGWVRDSEANKFTLMQVQRFANERLQEQGHLFLNELYDMIGAKRTRIGQQVGWVYDPENPDIDSYVDLRIFDINDERKRAFVNGYEKSIWIDPNVSCVVYDMIR